LAGLSFQPSGSFHSWTLEEIAKFESKHPIGTQARLALALVLYTGQRLSDLIQFGRQHTRDGWLVFTQHKGRKRKPIRLEIPIIPELQCIIDATPTGDLTYLVNERDTPWTAGSFGNRFRKWSRAAKLQGCPLHGLRKAAAARLAELGCSEFEIMAITGHTTSKKVARYTRAASQKIRAERAMRRLSAEQILDKNVPLPKVVAAGGTKPTLNILKTKGEI
jgi:integrase